MKKTFHNLWVILRRPLQILAGILLILVGIVGLILPVMPGWIFIFPGIYLLGPDTRPARFLRRQFRRLRVWSRLWLRRRRSRARAQVTSDPLPKARPDIADPARDSDA